MQMFELTKSLYYFELTECFLITGKSSQLSQRLEGNINYYVKGLKRKALFKSGPRRYLL